MDESSSSISMEEKGAITEKEHDLPPAFNLSTVDKWVLSQTDEEFKPHDWRELKGIIASNRLETLKRRPSDLRRYMKWTHDIKLKYGSMANYLLHRRLPWGSRPLTYASPVPFSNPEDFRILLNDWPYALTDDVTHLVVWSKTPIPTNETNGDLTLESWAIIDKFVSRTFANRLDGGAGRVAWFKNWKQLQSVTALEHIHVMVRYAAKQDIEFWTGQKP